VLPVVTGASGDVLGATLLRLVVAGLEPAALEPASPEPAEPDGAEAAPLDGPELAVVGLVKLLVGFVKLLVGLVKLLVGLGLAPTEPAELDAAEAPLGDVGLAVVGVRPAAVEPVMPPEPPVAEAAAPKPVGLFAELDVTGLAALDDAGDPAAPLAGTAGPSDIWITGTGPVENVLDPAAVTPLPPSTLYISR
jgi:hypothetical protein